MTMANEKHPSYRAYTVQRREGQEDFWLAIGAAFAHADGGGFNIVLQALPLDGRIVLRVPKEEESEEPPARQQQRPKDEKRPADRRGR